MIWETNIAYILEGSKDEYSLTDFQIGLLGSSFTFGMLFGTVVFGLVADRYGRMIAFKSDVCINAIFSLMLMLSFGPIMIAISLFFIGFGVAGELSLPGTIFYEFCPPSKAYYLTIMAGFWAIGGVFSALSALLTVLFNDTSIYSWRIIVACGFIVELFCVFFRFFLDESPAFYYASGQIEKMQNVLNKISKQNKGKEIVFDIRMGSENESVREIKNSDSSKMIKKVFSGKNFKIICAFCVVRCI